MMGKLLRFSIFGESHGKVVGCLIEGMPPGIRVDTTEIKKDLERRWGIRESSSSRREEDTPEILSGVFRAHTTGAPIAIVLKNRDAKSSYYEEIKYTPRPGHSDYTASVRYFGYNDYRGGGFFSGRLTAAMVVAGYFARKVLEREGVRVRGYIKRIGDIEANVSLENLFSSALLCPDEEAWEKMKRRIEEIRKEGDSIGGIVESVAIGVPAGLGGPFDDDLEGELSRAFFAIHGVKGVEFGAGFRFSVMKGSEANDNLIVRNGKLETNENNMGGILGGISNGMPIVARVVFKPTPSIYKEQKTVDLRRMENVSLKLRGRFDTCIVPKAVVVIESMMAFVLADHLLRRYSYLYFMNDKI
ncbi:MAG: chorismate synthase [Thermoplasmata archaeon]|nr:chorismate synthase [Thermoplasmata archaeon]